MKSLIRILSFVLICFSLPAQQPGAFPNPLIWLSADRCGQTAGVWQDLSGNGYHANFLNAQLPDTVLFNFNRAFDLDISSPGFMIDYRPEGTATITVLTVYRSADTASEQAIWNLKLDTIRAAALTTREMVTVSQRITYNSSTTNLPVLNSMFQNWRNRTIDTTTSRLVLLGGDTMGFRGKLAEFIVFDHALTRPQFQAIHTYLGLKYGISLRTINYVNGGGEVVWSTKANQQYAHDIAGIACDTVLGLLQKQGAGNGGDAPVTIAAATLAASSPENTATLHHGDFLIWGDNGLPMEPAFPDTLTLIQTSVDHLLHRTWLMQATGSTPHQLPTQVVFAGVVCDSCLVTALVIDPSSGGTFHPDSVMIHYPDSIDLSGRYYFSNIFWDVDHSGTDKFTFQVIKPVTMYKISQKSFYSDDSATSPDTFPADMQCALFPNPTPDRFSLVIALPMEEPLVVTILDPTGRLVSQTTLPASRLHHFDGGVDLPGLYLIHVSTHTRERTLKLMAR
jgi:hypothetical protein